MALGLGLHREPPIETMGDTLANERRRAVWWIVYSFDSGFSLTTGRPLMSSDCFIETRLPQNIEDSVLTTPRYYKSRLLTPIPGMYAGFHTPQSRRHPNHLLRHHRTSSISTHRKHGLPQRDRSPKERPKSESFTLPRSPTQNMAIIPTSLLHRTGRPNLVPRTPSSRRMEGAKPTNDAMVGNPTPVRLSFRQRRSPKHVSLRRHRMHSRHHHLLHRLPGYSSHRSKLVRDILSLPSLRCPQYLLPPSA